MKVLIDSQDGEFFIGRTEWDAPEIDQEVFVSSHKPLKVGTFHTVTITDAVEYRFICIGVICTLRGK